MTTTQHLDYSQSAVADTQGEVLGLILDQVPTVFGKLVYLASLHDSAGNHYQNAALGEYLSPAEADTILRTAHQDVFRQWQCMTLSSQCAELFYYLNHKFGKDAEVIRAWRNVERLDSLCPPGTYRSERNPFIADLLLAIRSVLYDLK